MLKEQMFRYLLLIFIFCLNCSQREYYASGHIYNHEPNKIAFHGQLCPQNVLSPGAYPKVLFAIDTTSSIKNIDVHSNILYQPEKGILPTIYRENDNVSYSFLALSDEPFVVEEQNIFISKYNSALTSIFSTLSQIHGTTINLNKALTRMQNMIQQDLQKSSLNEKLRSEYFIEIILSTDTTYQLNENSILKFHENIQKLIQEKYGNFIHIYVSFVGSTCNSSNFVIPDLFKTLVSPFNGSIYNFTCPENFQSKTIEINELSNYELVSFSAFNLNSKPTQLGLLLDTDSDGLDDDTEINITNTNYMLSDTDNDGIQDLIEVKLNTQRNPIEYEKTLNCSEEMFLQDTDNDLINDCEEFLIQTNKTIADTDGDTIPDGLEVRLGLNPNNIEDRILDSDQDGYTNQAESIQYSSPYATQTQADTYYQTKIVKTSATPVCYDVTIENITLFPNHQNFNFSGKNNIYIYAIFKSNSLFDIPSFGISNIISIDLTCNNNTLEKCYRNPNNTWVPLSFTAFNL